MVGLESGCRTNIRFRIEAHASKLKYFTNRAHESRIQMLGAKAVIAGVALYALVALDGGALESRMNVNGSYRTDVNAITAGDTLIRIDLHRAWRTVIVI
jgi:hypothetical protein